MKRFTRRKFLKNALLGSCGAAASGLVSPFGGSVARALSPKNYHLVAINLKGGVDSLYMVQPDESNSVNLPLNIKRPNVFLLEGDDELDRLGTTRMGVNSRLSSFLDAFNDGDLSVIMGVGVDNSILSHELADKIMAAGVSNANAKLESGWIQRLMTLAQVGDPLAVLDFSGGHFTTTEGGLFRPLAFKSFADARSIRSGAEDQLDQENYFRLDSLGLAMQQGGDLNKAAEMAKKNHIADFSLFYDDIEAAFDALPGGYPGGDIGQSLRQVDAAINDVDAASRPTISYIPHYGYDTHTGEVSTMATLLNQLNGALAPFRTSMMAQGTWDNVVVMIYSEFGRGIVENGMEGTDHANTQFVYLMGGRVNGGIVGTTPTIAEINGASGTLNLQNNWLDVLHAVISGMGYNANAVFPGFTAKGLNLIA